MLRSVFAGVVVIESFDQLLIVSSAGKNLFRRLHEFISSIFLLISFGKLEAESVLVLELVSLNKEYSELRNTVTIC